MTCFNSATRLRRVWASDVSVTRLIRKYRTLINIDPDTKAQCRHCTSTMSIGFPRHLNGSEVLFSSGGQGSCRAPLILHTLLEVAIDQSRPDCVVQTSSKFQVSVFRNDDGLMHKNCLAHRPRTMSSPNGLRELITVAMFDVTFFYKV